MKRSLARLGAIVALVSLACTVTPPSGGSVPAPVAPAGEKRAEKQVLRIGTNQFPPAPTPEASTSFIDVYGLQFDSLLRFDKNFVIMPGVATKWELTPENNWRFTLRQDLTFSNGDKLTAEDVAFTFETHLANRTQLSLQVSSVKGTKVIDPATIEIVTNQIDVPVLFTAPSWFVLPKKYYESVGKNGFAAKPIGSGPFTLEEIKPNDTYVYKLRSGGHAYRKPVLTEVSVRNIPEPQSIINGIRTGDLDFSNGVFAPENAKTAKDNGLITHINNFAYTSLIFYERNTKGTPLEDKRVRQAMNYAIDREAVSKNIFLGESVPLGQHAVPGTPNFNPDLKPWPYDVAKAKQLLAEAGYPDGFTLSGGLDYNTTALNHLQMQAIQDFHRRIGINYDIQSHEIGVWNDLIQIRNGRAPRQIMFAGGANSNGIFSFTWGFLRCEKTPPETVLFCVQGLDAKMKLALQEIDTEKRNKLLQEGMAAWVAEVPMLFLWTTPQFRIATSKVKGFEWTLLGFYSFDTTYVVE